MSHKKRHNVQVTWENGFKKIHRMCVQKRRWQGKRLNWPWYFWKRTPNMWYSRLLVATWIHEFYCISLADPVSFICTDPLPLLHTREMKCCSIWLHLKCLAKWRCVQLDRGVKVPKWLHCRQTDLGQRWVEEVLCEIRKCLMQKPSLKTQGGSHIKNRCYNRI